MQNYTKLVVFVALFCCSTQTHLPLNFHKCKRSSDDFNECLKAAIQDALPKCDNGIPELSIPKLQPLTIPEAVIGEGATGSVRVVQRYTDIKLYNLTGTNVDKVECIITDTEFNLTIQGIVPDFIWDSDYDFNGQILLIPITGNGQCYFRGKTSTAIINGALVFRLPYCRRFIHEYTDPLQGCGQGLWPLLLLQHRNSSDQSPEDAKGSRGGNFGSTFTPMWKPRRRNMSKISEHVLMTLSYIGKIYEKREKKYIKINTVKMDFKPEDFSIELKNLFNGDERLGQQMNKILNSNWKDLWADSGPSYERLFQTFLLDYINRMLKKLPLNTIFPL